MCNVCSDSRSDMASLRGPHLIPNNPNDSKATKTKMKGYPSGSGEKKKSKNEEGEKKMGSGADYNK